MEFGVEAAQGAWARLAGLPRLRGLQVVVDPNSWFAPRGWIGIVTVGTTVTASVPTAELEAPVCAALQSLSSDEATTPEVVTRRMPATRTSLGPAALFYPPIGFAVSDQVWDEASASELAELLGAASADDLDESGIGHLDSPAFVSRSREGSVAAASGYRRWPNGVAHVSVLTHPGKRRQGHAQRAATVALRRAIDEGLLPQWRARPSASRALARALGLVAVGAQLCFEPA